MYLQVVKMYAIYQSIICMNKMYSASSDQIMACFEPLECTSTLELYSVDGNPLRLETVNDVLGNPDIYSLLTEGKVFLATMCSWLFPGELFRPFWWENVKSNEAI